MSSVNLSAEQVYSEIRQVSENVVRLITKMDMIVDDTRDHEKRLRNLERKIWMMSGASAIIGVLSGIAAQFFS